MSESYWPETEDAITFSYNTLLAQTFMPLWSHTLEYIRVKPGFMLPHHICEVSIQSLKPDGTPTGGKLTSIIIDFFELWGINRFGTYQWPIKPIRLVVGFHYALVFRQLVPFLLPWMQTLYVPAPSGYPRGKLIRSTDGGSTWDTTDLGDIVFGEWGDPPRPPNPHVLPLDHWAAITLGTTNYSTSACIRISTTSPVYAVCHITEDEPKPMYYWRTIRGVRSRCLKYYAFVDWRSYRQLEKTDSIYHTFRVGKLKEGHKYWFTFTAESDFTLTSSIAPIVARVHPGGPPFTTLRRPDAPGALCAIPYETANPCPDHYLNIDEATPDDEASQIWTDWPHRGFMKRDLYHIPNYGMDERPIDQLHLVLRLKYAGTRPAYAGYEFLIYTHGTLYNQALFGDLDLTYGNHHWHYYLNPFTNLPWTPAEIDDLQIGVGLWYNTGVGWSVRSYCTQVYCTIEHKCKAFE